MTRFRFLLLRFYGVVLCMALATFAARIMIPAGHMPVPGADGFGLRLCSGTVAQPTPTGPGTGMGHSMMQQTGKEHGGDHQNGDDAARSPCPYIALSMTAFTDRSADLLTVAIAFVTLLWTIAVNNAPSGRAAYCQPKSRAPPLRS